MIPACRVRYGIVRHEQAVGIFVRLCILLSGCHLRRELVGVHCPGIGKGHIVQRIIRQSVVHRVGNAHAGEVKVIDSAGSKVELLWGNKLRRQFGYVRRNIIVRSVELAIAAKPLEVAAGISVGAGQTFGRRRSKALAVFHNDLDSLRAAAQFAAAKVKGNGFQPVRTHRTRVQDFKDGAETDVRVGARSIDVVPVAGRIVPANRTERRVERNSILSPRIHFIPVLDISAVLIQHRVPFVALGLAGIGIAQTCSVTSHRRCAQGIVHAAAGIIFAENQICGVQVIPANRMRYGIVRHEQAVGILVLLCILLCGCHLRRELVGVHCPSIGKGDIAHCFVRQSIVHRAGDAHCREVKVIGAAGGEGELLWEIKLCRELGDVRRNIIARCVELAVVVTPHKVIPCISVGAGQAVGGRCGKYAAGFHDNLDAALIAQFAAAKVQGNGFQPVRAQ